MTRKTLPLLYAVFAWAAAIAPARASAAEVRYREVIYDTGGTVKPVGDADGHVAGTWEKRGVCLYGKDVGTYFGTGTVDMTKGKGAGGGESTCTFEDGSSHTLRFTMSIEPAGKGLVKWTGRGEFVAGTGRFDGIRGAATFSGRTYTPIDQVTRGDAVVDLVARHTVRKKPVAQQ